MSRATRCLYLPRAIRRHYVTCHNVPLSTACHKAPLPSRSHTNEGVFLYIQAVTECGHYMKIINTYRFVVLFPQFQLSFCSTQSGTVSPVRPAARSSSSSHWGTPYPQSWFPTSKIIRSWKYLFLSLFNDDISSSDVGLPESKHEEKLCYSNIVLKHLKTSLMWSHLTLSIFCTVN
jgi:hypothetical protein